MVTKIIKGGVIRMNHYVAKGINVSCRTIDGEAFIFDQQTRILMKLDIVGSIVWDQIDGTKTVEQISDFCCEVFEGDRKEIQTAIKEFINDLHSKNVVVFSTEIFEEEMRSAC